MIKKIFLILLMFTLSSCFFRERRVDYVVDGCDVDLFCSMGDVYKKNEVGDSIPFRKSLSVSFRNFEKYGIVFNDSLKIKVSTDTLSLVDEDGHDVYLSFFLKNENQRKKIELKNVSYFSEKRRLYLEIQTPSISSYEIEVRFEKQNGEAYVFNFRVIQSERKEWVSLPLSILGGI